MFAPALSYVATVNGGVWKSMNIHTADNSGLSIVWTPTMDTSSLKCSSIAYFNMGLTNRDWLVAVCARPSNYKTIASELNGGMVSLNAGFSWTQFGSSLPTGLQLTGVVASGAGTSAGTRTITVSARCQETNDVGSCTMVTQAGIWRSTDNGATWTQISLAGGANAEAIWHLDRDPHDDTFLVALGNQGVWVSTNSGQSFTLTTSGLSYVGHASFNNIHNGVVSISSPSGQTRTIYVGVTQCPQNGDCTYAFFWSANSGTSWTSLNQPLLTGECRTGSRTGARYDRRACVGAFGSVPVSVSASLCDRGMMASLGFKFPTGTFRFWLLDQPNLFTGLVGVFCV